MKVTIYIDFNTHRVFTKESELKKYWADTITEDNICGTPGEHIHPMYSPKSFKEWLNNTYTANDIIFNILDLSAEEVKQYRIHLNDEYHAYCDTLFEEYRKTVTHTFEIDV